MVEQQNTRKYIIESTSGILWGWSICYNNMKMQWCDKLETLQHGCELFDSIPDAMTYVHENRGRFREIDLLTLKVTPLKDKEWRQITDRMEMRREQKLNMI